MTPKKSDLGENVLFERVPATLFVRRDFGSLRDNFTAGEILTFRYDAWSRYEGMTGYFFEQPDAKWRIWDISDDDDLEIWKELFEEESLSEP